MSFDLDMVNGDTRLFLHTAWLNGAPVDFNGCTITLELASKIPELTASFSTSDGSVVLGTVKNDIFIPGGLPPYYAAQIQIVSAPLLWPNFDFKFFGQVKLVDTFGNPVTDDEGFLTVHRST